MWIGGVVVLLGVCLAGTAVLLLQANNEVARQLYLRLYLVAREEQLQQPAAEGSVPVAFTIAPGETAGTVAANLAAAGLLNDTELFRNYVRFHGLDAELEAGDHLVQPQWTIPQLAQALTEAAPEEVTVRFVEGWRIEQMAATLDDSRPANVDADQFLAIAQRQASFDLSRYPFLASLPADATLEGFLFPDTYRLPPDADAAYLVDLMLRNFGRRVTPAMRQAYGVRGLSLREAVTLASIVEREAQVAAERPLMAGVFYNRLAQGMKLEADPTVQYALGYQPASDQWWKSPLTLADLQFDSPYNTYVTSGLPPGPIANPGLAALEAVAQPVATEFLFFVVDCNADVPGSHIFSVTYEEHLAHVQRCR